MKSDRTSTFVASHRGSPGARFLVRVTRLAALVPLMVGVVSAGGCHDDRIGPGTTTILLLQKPASNSGDEQSDTVLTTLASPLRVLVLRDGVPASGVEVSWSVPAGQGSVSASTTMTDAEGIASVTRTLGPTAGTQTTEATLVGAVGPRVAFTATARLRSLALAAVSDPVAGVAASAPGATGSRLSASDSEVVYVSLPPEAMPNGEAATVRNPRTGAFVTTVMTAGGFDPVAVGASVGDTLELEIGMTAGASQTFALIVPALRRPIVVRTDPPPRKRDVPLNARIVIVFSEPIERGTITVRTMRLLLGGQTVAGRAVLSADGLRAEFLPDSPLAPQTEFALLVSTEVADLDGARLAQPLDVSFTTGSAATDVTSVTVTPADAAVVADSNRSIGRVQLTATARDSSGAMITDRTVAWTTSNPQVAQVSATGLVSGVSPGTATITATSGTASACVMPNTCGPVSGTAAITVLIPIAAMSISPASATLEVGATLALVASATDAAGQPVTGYRVDWNVPPHLALVSATGGTANVRGATLGSGQVCAYFNPPTGGGWGGTCADVLVPNRAPVASVTVLPDTLRTVPVPYSIGAHLHAILRDASGNEILYGPAVAWSSTDPSLNVGSAGFWERGRNVQYLSGSGTVGSATVTATIGGRQGTATVVIDYVTLSAVSVGGNTYRCYLTSTGAAYCEHGNQSGELGMGVAGGGSQVPVAVAGGLRFTALSTGFNHTCALTPAGAAYCWGNNDWGSEPTGQLGAGPNVGDCNPLDGQGRSCSHTPLAVVGGLTFTQISAGSTHTCGLTAGGRAYCWGRNAWGGLGDGTTASSPTPVAVAGGLTFAQISAGFHTCGLTTGGAAYCWGNNLAGALGDGTTTSSPTPVPVAGGLTFAQISAAIEGRTCGVTPGGAAYCWGSNAYGELGNGLTTNSSIPVPVALPNGVSLTQIDAGYVDTCGLATDGAAYCWPWFDPGSYNWTPVAPTRVPGGLSFTSVRSGYFLSCGITRDTVVYCWDSQTGTLDKVEGQR